MEGREDAIENGGAAEVENVPGMCVECRDQPISGYCEQCQDDYCDVCFQAQHRRGKRATHKFLRAQVAATSSATASSSSTAATMDGVEDSESVDEETEGTVVPRPSANTIHQRSFLERAKYIPLRLAYDERKQFRLLAAALNVSEYTDKVDVYTFHKSKVRLSRYCWTLFAILLPN